MASKRAFKKYVGGESKEDESEDLNELLADADEFICNKKMRR